MLSKIAQVSIILILVLLFGVPSVIAALPIFAVDELALKALFIFISPFSFSASIVLLAGIISRPVQRSIISGVFPRDLNTPLYFGRKVYGLCLSTIMHFSAIYFLILNIPLLKRIMLRLFGYEGKHVNFTTYTDTWMRDVKLLSLGNQAYLANQATLGTNICLTDGNIMVGRIKIGDHTQLGRLCILGPGTRLGNHCETGVRTIMGIRSVMKDGAKIAGDTTISHGVVIHENAHVQEYSYVGKKAEIHPGIRIPVSSNIPAGTIILTQSDADKFAKKQDDEIQSRLRERLTLLSNSSF